MKIDICMLLGLSSLTDVRLASPPFSRSELTLKGINGAPSQKDKILLLGRVQGITHSLIAFICKMCT